MASVVIDRTYVGVRSPTPAESAASQRLPYLHDIHTFRALAIVSIVAAHCLPLFRWNHLHSHGGWPLSLMPNGTVFFIFIAGFLFQYLSGKFEFSNYLKKKWHNVLLPYLLASIAILSVQAFVTHAGSFEPSAPHHWPNPFENAVWSLLTGYQTTAPFWFIPMITVFYFLAPVFLWLDRDGRIYRVLPLLLGVAVFVHRPADGSHIWQSCAYFVPVYFYGMWFSRNRERAMAWHDRWLPVLLVCIAAITCFEVVYLRRPGYIASAGMFSTEHGIFDTNLIQKLLLCGVVPVICHRLGQAFNSRLRYLGNISFGVFFVHMLFINGYTLLGFGSPQGNLLLYSLSVIITTALSIAFISLVKLTLGRYSRYLIGC